MRLSTAFFRQCGYVSAAVLLVLSAVVPAVAAVQYRWVQLTAGEPVNGILQPRVRVRAIVDQQDDCPTLYVAGGEVAADMTERQRDPALQNFDDIKAAQERADQERRTLSDRVTRLEGQVSTWSKVQLGISAALASAAAWFGAKAP